MPLFSIITVTYQNLYGLRKTASSISKQTHTDYEWIVIDGGSRDGTTDFLEKTQSKWISDPDDGIYDAMNKGISRATGDYLIFMNAGDCFAAPDILSHIAKAIEHASEPPDFIYGDALEERLTLSLIRKPYYKAARSHKKWIYGMFTHHQAMLYSNDFISKNDLRYDDTYPIAADYKLTLQCLRRTKKVLKIKDKAICLFEQGGVSQKHYSQGRGEQFKIREELDVIPFWRNAMVYLLQTIAYQCRRFSPSLYWFIKGSRR